MELSGTKLFMFWLTSAAIISEMIIAVVALVHFW